MLVWAFDPAVALEYQAALFEAELALLAEPRSPAEYGYQSYLDDAVRDGLDAVGLHHSLVTERAVDEAHVAGLRVYTWTVDEPDDLARVRAAGVDGICTNLPARAFAVLRSG